MRNLSQYIQSAGASKMALTCTAARALFLFLCVLVRNYVVFIDVSDTSVKDLHRTVQFNNFHLYISHLSSSFCCRLESSLPSLYVAARPPWRPPVRLRFCKSCVAYYSNADCTFNLPLDVTRLITLSGDVHCNPGPISSSPQSSPSLSTKCQLSAGNNHNGDQQRQSDNGHKIRYTSTFLRDLRYTTNNSLDVYLTKLLQDNGIVNRRFIRPRGVRAGRCVQQRMTTCWAMTGRHFYSKFVGQPGQLEEADDAAKPIPVIVGQRRTRGRPTTLGAAANRWLAGGGGNNPSATHWSSRSVDESADGVNYLHAVVVSSDPPQTIINNIQNQWAAAAARPDSEVSVPLPSAAALYVNNSVPGGLLAQQSTVCYTDHRIPAELNPLPSVAATQQLRRRQLIDAYRPTDVNTVSATDTQPSQTDNTASSSQPNTANEHAISFNSNTVCGLTDRQCHLVNIPLEDSRLPVFLLTNINHVLNKFDELFMLTKRFSPSVIAITETFLDATLPDDAVSINNYTVTRKDRSSVGGGVLLYIANNLKFTRLTDFESDNYEVLWVSVRPSQLPRPLSLLIFAVVYCPPSYKAEQKKNLADFLLTSCDALLRKYPDCGVFITGDFNTLDTGLFNKYLHLNQIVTKATRGNNILDKIFTNCKKWYSTPIILPPVGKSDHNVILVRPSSANNERIAVRSVFTRHMDFYACTDIAAELSRIKWQDMYHMEDCRLQADFFYSNLNRVLDSFAPIEEHKIKDNDRPWVTAYFKKLINKRDVAYRMHDMVLYKKLRNRVNRIRKSLQKQYFLDKVQCLKTDNPSNWWKNIKTICKFNKKVQSTFEHVTYADIPVNKHKLPDVINNFFTNITSAIPALNTNKLTELRQSCGPLPDYFIIEEEDVFNALNRLKDRKSIGPDCIPNRLLRNMSHLFAAPICAIINSSLRQGVVPDEWKIARISPLPKSFPVNTVEHDIRPISITNSIAKIAESFVSRFFNEHFQPLLDINQFGCTARRSTTHALIKLTNEWFKASDNSNNIIRILFLDFSKAFDFIDHNILLQKFVDYNFPPHISVWSLAFLQDRKQFVSVNNITSSVLTSNAGTPQGTVAGPNDFKLLINDLRFKNDSAKYVDDITVSSVSTDPYDSSLQSAANHSLTWSAEHGMYINEIKTKELLIHFNKKTDRNSIPGITVNGKTIERVETFKLLGVMISSDLSWDAHVIYMLNKVGKRMFCIHYLARAGISEADIVHVYCSIIRSVLEYACPVWHPGLTKAQSKEIERVQKRCLRVIYPSLTYSEL